MNLTGLIKLAWRNLWRQKRRTILTLISISFGGFLAIMMTALQDETWLDFIDTAARLGAGHVTVQHHEYRDQPTLSRSITGTDAIRAAAMQDARVVRVVDRSTGSAMIATANDSFGGYFIAYDPARETDETMEFTDGLVSGELFDSADADGVVLGHILASNLGAELGDKVVYTLTDRHGEIVSGMERLSGVIETGAASTDAALMLLPLGKVREVIGYGPDEATQVAVFLEDGRDAQSVRDALAAVVADDAAVLTWDELQPEIKTFVAMKVGGGRVMIGVIGLLVAAGIFNTIFMSVLERTREFGIMLAIGYSPRQLFSMVLLESGFLAVLGLVGTAVVTYFPYTMLAESGIDISSQLAESGGSMDIGGVGMDTVMPVGIFPESLAAIAILIVVATVVAGLYPAYKAGRVNPVESINLV